ncbi:hypothetical protein PUNSTDRAFT_111245 [Punctularia strigosozonata HHB-11173 SS5]|uniref:uncharacterized protein n=1 Tax=Punctularia strigosozonata (strain HHB-11173) TaxID=741275 RepID=UPI0004416528|nr:uncharacterized protein PUNSTDRAFT_111245 [Punctularia strigosozonata HHB-11173 SS5]EIN12874.1 hypothetical protein PUNSTDRAFT_111245 [Punctularia strigosozonata HHB-11173 SS5]
MVRSQKGKKRQQSSPEDDDEAPLRTAADQPKKKVRWSSDHDDDNEEAAEILADEISEETGSDKICLAATCHRGRLGCAYYEPVQATVYVLEDTNDSVHFDLTKMLFEQANPDIVLTGSRADDEFIDLLRDLVDASSGRFTIRPWKDFAAPKGRERLLCLPMLLNLSEDPQGGDVVSTVSGSSEPRNAYDFMQRRREVHGDPVMQRWNAGIRLANFTDPSDSPLCMGSIAALLDHLARERAIGDLEPEGLGALDVRAIKSVSLEQVMQINSDALSSLQIFENESHASIHSDKTKEGLSLFGILNNTRMSLGRALLRQWLLRPSLSFEVIQARHDAVECFSRPENLTTAGSMHAHLKGIKNLPRFMANLRAGRAGVIEWQGLVKFAFHAVMLHDVIQELNQARQVLIIQKLHEVLDVAAFRVIGETINNTIDWEESDEAKRVCIRPQVDEELDNLKHIYHGIDSVLSNVAEQICASIPPDYVPSLNVVYFPQLGFLICLPMLEEWKSGQDIQVLDGWSFQFSSESHVYFKSPEMRDMDTHIGDLQPSIVDREIEIAQSLLEQLLAYDNAICDACHVCAELDCLLSFAEVSRALDYRRPTMVERNVIHIKQGRQVLPTICHTLAAHPSDRHPLQEQVVDTFVPNDVTITGGAGLGVLQGLPVEDDDVPLGNSVVICTGANACGKSVYLKQTAVIQFMAQMMCSFVPAESATLGIVDKIFTRIQTTESVSKVQSAFMIDLNQVSLALRNATARSLILLDEFGKGTISTDGAGLFCGVIKHLLSRGAACPKVMATTHFPEIFDRELLDVGALPITLSHMEVLVTSSDGNIANEPGQFAIKPGEKITYLYRVANGLSVESHATMCAELFGIPRRIVERAQYVSHLLSIHEVGELLDEDMNEDERVELEVAEAICRRFLTWDLSPDRDDSEPVKTTLATVLGRTAEG